MVSSTPKFTLSDLEAIIASRAKDSAGMSYTRKLLDRGTPHCAKKFGEEAVETVIAAISEDDAHFTAECADTLYHLLVLLRARGVPLADVEAVLQERTKISGLEEKASRAPAAS
jgi:phosphoribosyl-ATP pyrophosphohydrolase